MPKTSNRKKQNGTNVDVLLSDENKKNKVTSNKKKSRKTECGVKVQNSKKVNAVTGMRCLPPLPLVITIFVCSGFMWMLAFRDLMATGRSLYGEIDDAMLHFTKSKRWFESSRGWKSQAGGLSSIKSYTTDDNDMGGLFIRKWCGAAALIVHSQKLIPVLFHPTGANWRAGHFNPVLLIAVLGNLCVASFYYSYMPELASAGTDGLSLVIIAVSTFEACVMFLYFLSARRLSLKQRGPFSALPPGKTPTSITNRIIMRTVSIVSTAMVLIAGRDLFFPGFIFKFIPRDDIYLEWTGAFIHSPPVGSPEIDDNAMLSPLHVGDKFVSQLAALYLLLSCGYKFATAYFIRWGQNNSGEIKCRIIWKVQWMGDGLLVFVLRLFAAACKSASLDIRWHLMCIAYEGLILALYSIF